MESALKTIVVSGDCVWDYDIVAQPMRRYDPIPPIKLSERRAGAWRLAEFVKIACSDIAKEVSVEGPVASAPATPTLLKWSPYEKKTGARPPELVWRCQLVGRDPTMRPGRAAPDETRNPSLVVLEDLNLGFRDLPEAWPRALSEGEPNILLRTWAPVAKGQLWERLLTKHADRLTVLVSADSLRARGAEIEPSVSWDLAVDQTVKEFKSGFSERDLARCKRVIVHFRSAGAIVFDKGNYERLVYDPEDLEGRWEKRRPGRIYDAIPLLTAAIARHVLRPETYPIFICLGRALSAVRVMHERGGGSADEPFDPAPARAAIQRVLHPPDQASDRAEAYFAGFSREKFVFAVPSRYKQPAPSLLQDATGPGPDFMLAKACEVVLRGEQSALAAVPKGRFGKYLTVDPDEIALLNAIRQVIETYRENRGDKRPRCFAVFGPPGSGKSTAIKNLAEEIFGAKPSLLEFNLSQFQTPDDLHAAFQLIRDESIRGKLPLVLWDEFDSKELTWLGHFLAPMQDAAFSSGGLTHPFEKSIFVFAGGTCATFEKFDQTNLDDAHFKARKGPDFISRLHGYVNIKGPNPVDAEDSAHLIRRALNLRFVLGKISPRLIDDSTGLASVSMAVVQAFLQVKKFHHGARSLETVVSTSSLSDAAVFGAAQLPHPDLLRLHVSPDFHGHLRAGQLGDDVMEALAEAAHEGWMKMKKKQEFSYGAKRDDARKLHPLLKPYGELEEKDKEGNRLTARLTPAKLAAIGYKVIRGQAGEPAVSDVFKQLLQLEHDIWWRDHLLKGYEFAAVTNDPLRLHCDMQSFDALGSGEQALDQAIIDSIIPTLLRHGYTIEKIDPALETGGGLTLEYL